MRIKYILLIAALAFGTAFVIYTAAFTSEPAPSMPVAILPTIKSPTNPYVYPTENPFLAELLVDYEAFLTTSLHNNLAPGFGVAIVHDTSIVYLKGFGLRDKTKNEPVDIHTVFRIASVSKCFASMLTGILVDKQQLRWDDAVIKYLPDFKLKSEEYTKSLTLRHVLSHTTGLPYHAFTDRVDDGAAFDTLVYHLRDLDVSKPGQIYSYQNVGYSLIGKVVQAATGKSYEQNLKEKIFDPLEMQTASTSYEAMMKNTNTARPHRFTGKWIPTKISETYYDVSPAGGINASTSDMARWLLSLTVDPPKVLTRETENEIFHPFVRATSRNYNFRRWKPIKSAFYALGWRVLNFKDDTLDYHGGYVNGFRSEVAIDRKDKFAICVLVNAPGQVADISIPKFFELYSKHREAILRWEKGKGQIVAVR